jgi:riboflavin biosynthesis pyrimidine reductase
VEGGRDDMEASDVIVMSAPDEQALARIRAVVAAVEEPAEQPIEQAGCSTAANPAAPSPACIELCAGDAKAAARSKEEFAELLKAEFERLMVSGGGMTANQAAAQAMVHVKATLATAAGAAGDASGEGATTRGVRRENSSDR